MDCLHPSIVQMIFFILSDTRWTIIELVMMNFLSLALPTTELEAMNSLIYQVVYVQGLGKKDEHVVKQVNSV